MATNYTIDELNAMRTIRKAMLKKPEIITDIMHGMAYESANNVLLKAQIELTQLLEVSRAFTAAAATLAQSQKAAKQATDAPDIQPNI